MTQEMFKAWMPLTKSSNGTFVGILSDTSLDRDEEFMTKELLDSWASMSTTLPMLANHENKMEKFIGSWTNKRVINNGENAALVAEPFFFSKEANPLAHQIKKQVEEALEMGLGIGISIGAIPQETIEKECEDGKRRKGFKKAEIVEATIVPIQSNRNASFVAVAKSFGINTEESNMEENINKEVPVEEVTEEVVSEEQEQVTEEVADDISEEPVSELEEKVEECEECKPKLSEEEAQKVVDETKDLKVQLEKALKEIKELKSTAVLKATVEGPLDENAVEVQESWTIEKMLKSKFKK